MELDSSHVQAYLARWLETEVEVLAIEPLGAADVAAVEEHEGGRQSLKMQGYGEPVLVHYRTPETEDRAVLRTQAPNRFGYERRADRAAGLLLSYDTFNDLPRHAQALDVGVLTPDAELKSVGDGDEFFLLTDYVPGEPYAHDLERIRDAGTFTDLDVRRVRRLAKYLAEIHAVKRDDPALYQRRTRDLLGSGEGIMGLTDSYPPDFELVDAEWLAEVEKECVDWRWRLNQRSQRLSQVHGDFHPFNVLFADDVEFWVLDRSRGAWGEPGDDVSCMAVNYLFFSLQRSEAMAPPFQELWDVWWNTYLELSEDEEVLSVLAPFFTWRALVIASPVWYNVSNSVRSALFRFIENVLRDEAFDPSRVNEYLV